jgi:hypothetical protein
MRIVLALLLTVLCVDRASAACICRCVDDQMRAICSSAGDLPSACMSRSCSDARPPGGPARAAIAMPPAAPSAPADMPASATTAIEPSEPPPLSGSSGSAMPPPSAGASELSIPVPSSASRAAPCYPDRRLNPYTLEYEWRQICE